MNEERFNSNSQGTSYYQATANTNNSVHEPTSIPYVQYVQVEKKRPVRNYFVSVFAVFMTAALIFSVGSSYFLYRHVENIQKQYDQLLAGKKDGGASEGKVNAEVTAQAERNVSHIQGKDLTTQEIVKQTIPAVVAVKTQIQVNSFFGSDTLRGAGSGVIIDKAGYIVTNYHVIESSTAIEVQIAVGDKQTYKADLVAGDARTDLAVLKIADSEGPFPYVELADSDAVEIGERAIAIGNPLGDLEGTVTQGIVSGLGREVYTKSSLSGSMTRLENILQTDASINEGNSGGALLNSEGKLIGINTAKVISRDGVLVEGIGFAIPSNTVKDITDELLQHGYVSGRPKLGVSITDVTEAASKTYGMPVGAYVLSVEEDSAAAQAGIQARDIITKLAGQEVTGSNVLSALKDQYKAGETVKIEVWRQGKYLTLDLTFSESLPDDKTKPKESAANGETEASKAELQSEKDSTSESTAESSAVQETEGKARNRQ